jgi:hypothetical protein
MSDFEPHYSELVWIRWKCSWMTRTKVFSIISEFNNEIIRTTPNYCISFIQEDYEIIFKQFR